MSDRSLSSNAWERQLLRLRNRSELNFQLYTARWSGLKFFKVLRSYLEAEDYDLLLRKRRLKVSDKKSNANSKDPRGQCLVTYMSMEKVQNFCRNRFEAEVLQIAKLSAPHRLTKKKQRKPFVADLSTHFRGSIHSSFVLRQPITAILLTHTKFTFFKPPIISWIYVYSVHGEHFLRVVPWALEKVLCLLVTARCVYA